MAQRKHPFQNENTGEDLNPAQESEVPENSAVRTRNAPKPYPMNAPAPVSVTGQVHRVTYQVRPTKPAQTRFPPHGMRLTS
jgi:hypothetical protein